jgi:predicted AlkP superfamily phosphohydrolase/phosphomutase
MRTLLIGLDAFDPALFEQLHNQGKTPNLSRFVESKGYARLRVADPPQSEVSWTSIATGLDPGGHGMFDFVHRDPTTYRLQVSLLPTRKNVLGLQFVPPHNARTLFEEAVSEGYPATSLWWPATFPARLASPVRTLPGLGTPDILGRLGVGIHYSTHEPPGGELFKTPTRLLSRSSAGRFTGAVEGPAQKTIKDTRSSTLDFELQVKDGHAACLLFGRQVVELALGKWSPIFELSFKAGFGVTLKAVTRAVLVKNDPEPEVYFLPLQLHPLSSPWPYGTPKGFIKDIWNRCGPYLTLGWPQDTTGLEEGWIDDEQFLDLCERICQERERIFLHLLDSFDEGILACVFDTLDRVQHMFWRDRPDVIESWYRKLDALVGRILAKLAARPVGRKTRVLILSDHGFGDYSHKVHLNRWLVEQGYLRQFPGAGPGDLKNVDWSASRAYALGLNSLYLNLQDREGQGIVPPGQRDGLIASLREALLRWKGPDGGQVVQNVLSSEKAFHGPLAEYGPDLVVGYRPGYRASAETGTGQWKDVSIEANPGHWGADHCFTSQAVPGVLFDSRGLDGIANPSYADIPILAIGTTLRPEDTALPPSYSDEDQETIEKRLKDLGYL